MQVRAPNEPRSDAVASRRLHISHLVSGSVQFRVDEMKSDQISFFVRISECSLTYLNKRQSLSTVRRQGATVFLPVTSPNAD